MQRGEKAAFVEATPRAYPERSLGVAVEELAVGQPVAEVAEALPTRATAAAAWVWARPPSSSVVQPRPAVVLLGLLAPRRSVGPVLVLGVVPWEEKDWAALVRSPWAERLIQMRARRLPLMLPLLGVHPPHPRLGPLAVGSW